MYVLWHDNSVLINLISSCKIPNWWNRYSLKVGSSLYFYFKAVIGSSGTAYSINPNLDTGCRLYGKFGSRTWIQGLMTKNFKMFDWKKQIFGIKICKFLLRPPRRIPSYRRGLPVFNENFRLFKPWQFLIFLFLLWVIFAFLDPKS